MSFFTGKEMDLPDTGLELVTTAEGFDGTTWWCDHTRQVPGGPVERVDCPDSCLIRHPMAVEASMLPRYDARDVFPPDGYGWEPLEPEWDRPGHEWYRSLWRLWAPVPAKRNKRPYGGRRRR